MDLEDNLHKFKQSPLHTYLKKSVSTIALMSDFQNFTLREAKSFTSAIEELTNRGGKYETHEIYHQNHKQIYPENCTPRLTENGYETREITSDQIFFVKEEMLTYRGKRYSIADIAQKWKKDCRKWLWKSNKNRKNKSLLKLCEKLQNMNCRN